MKRSLENRKTCPSFVNLCSKIHETMTELGNYLSKKSVNKSDVARKTGISKTRLSELSNNSNTKLKVDELCLIAKAIDVDPCEMLNEICRNLKLEANQE